MGCQRFRGYPTLRHPKVTRSILATIVAISAVFRAQEALAVNVAEPHGLVERAYRGSQARPYAGNAVRLLIADDPIGRTLAAALKERAANVVRVFLFHDLVRLLGPRVFALLDRPQQCWRPGPIVEPRLASPLAWLRRDHRR